MSAELKPLDHGAEGSADRHDRVLRAKFLDWCSARLAEHFLRLSPEEIFELAEEGAPGDAAGQELDTLAALLRQLWGAAVPDEAAAWPAPAPAAAGGGEGGAELREMVTRVTEALTRRVGLPSFEEWSAAYREDPERFDPDLLGFWREEV